MLNDFIALFLGAFNYFFNDFTSLENEYRYILVIIVSALTIICVSLTMVELIKATLIGLFRTFRG